MATWSHPQVTMGSPFIGKKGLEKTGGGVK